MQKLNKNNINPAMQVGHFRSFALLTLSFKLLLFSSPVLSATLKEILEKPGVAEQMQANYAGKGTYDGQQDTPLVIQARQFALRINPPPPPMPANPQPQENRPIRPQVQVSAKFKLIGTSYHFGDPQQSWALIDEVGKGLHWVQQGSTVGHLCIEKIGDGAVLINDNGRKYELLAERPGKPDLVKSYSGILEVSEPIVLLSGGEKVVEVQSVESPPQDEQTHQLAVNEELTVEEQLRRTQENIEWLKQMQADQNSASLGPQEANDLSGLGEMLKTLEEEAQRLQQLTTSKLQKDANKSEPAPSVGQENTASAKAAELTTQQNSAPSGPSPSVESDKNQQPAAEQPKQPVRLRRIRERR